MSLGNILAKIAPTIAGLFGGPLAAGGVTALEEVFGVTPDQGSILQDRISTLEARVAGATPDEIVAMKKADDDLKAKFVDAGITLNAQDDADRASARQMQMATKSAFVPVMASLVATGFFGLLVLMAYHLLPPGQETVFTTMLGALATGFGQVINFYFGSSASHQDTVKMLAAATGNTGGAANQSGG